MPVFWLTFFVCGYTSNGIVLTHFMPHAADHGFSPMTAAQALGVMGAMNVVGTIASGWVCDRFGRRGPLAAYYFLRGLSLLFLLYVWNVPSLGRRRAPSGAGRLDLRVAGQLRRGFRLGRRPRLPRRRPHAGDPRGAARAHAYRRPHHRRRDLLTRSGGRARQGTM